MTYPSQQPGYGADYGSERSNYPGQSYNDYGSQNNSSHYNGPSSGYGVQSSNYPNQGQGQYQGQGQDQQQVQYDENGNPLPPGERGVGTMAVGALGE